MITCLFFSPQVTEGKQALEKCLKLARKFKKEIKSLTEWLAAVDSELTCRSSVEGMPSDLEAELTWAKVGEHINLSECRKMLEILIKFFFSMWGLCVINLTFNIL